MIRPVIRIVLVAIVWQGVASGQSIQRRSDVGRREFPRDPAALLPKETLFYVELARPAEVAPRLHEFIRGTVLENLLEHLARRREQSGPAPLGEDIGVGLIGCLLSPELLDEISRLDGLAVAVTHLDEADDPVIVGVVLAGKSHLPTLLTRFLLTVGFTTQIAGKFGDVVIYGQTNIEMPAPILPAPVPVPPPRPIPQPPFIAFTPGLIVIGNRLNAVTDVLKRWQGESKGPSLRDRADWSALASWRQKPGLFASVQNQRLGTWVSQLFAEGLDPAEAERWAKSWLPPDRIRAIRAHVGVEGDAIEFRVGADLVSGQSHPLIDLFTSPASPASLASSWLADAPSGWGFRFKNGRAWWPALLAWLDQVCEPQQIRPSNRIADIEKKVGCSIADDIVTGIDDIGVAWPTQQQLPRDAIDIPIWSLTMRDATSAQRLESLVPVLVGAFTNESLEPISETIEGVKVRSLASQVFPWNAPLHYARQKNRIVFGLDRRIVVGVLKSSIEPPERSANSLPEFLRTPSVVGYWQWGRYLISLSARPQPQEQPPQGAVPPKNEAAGQRQRPLFEKALAERVKQIPPLVIAIESPSDPQRPTIIARQALPKPIRTFLVDRIIDWMLDGWEAMNEPPNVPMFVPMPPIKN